ncbi:MAG TPA: GlsB/YeaQ/YmgE family stress response membrane protein [Terriglobales bacterium]|nr:GlsB/YeaQ/YmgE family stress response membrane protein [Terriglobales bacterium]
MIAAIIIGLIVGVLAKLLHPGRDDIGIIFTILLGIGGSMVATWLGHALGFYEAGEAAGFLASILGAVLLLAVVTRLRR